MTKNNKIEIILSKSKLAKLLIFSILFLGCGIWMIVTNPQTGNPIFNNFLVKGIAAYGSTIMGVLGIYFFSKKLLDRRPGLIIDENGIYDNTSAFQIGLIPWNDISQIYERTVRASIASKQRFITIGLTNPEKYISREKNFLKRRILKINAVNYGSPVHISTNGLKINHNELLRIINEEYVKYKPLGDRNKN